MSSVPVSMEGSDGLQILNDPSNETKGPTHISCDAVSDGLSTDSNNLIFHDTSYESSISSSSGLTNDSSVEDDGLVDSPVLIVGAGPTGLLLAYLLSKLSGE
jgi:hypothetical protein